MATKRKVGNLLALAVLSYLTQRPMHPYGLSRTLRDNDDARSVKYNHGSLYMVVQQLTKAGFITPLETNREGQRPERTVYALTDAGRHELRDWLRELIAEPKHEYPHFVTALSLIGALPPSQARVNRAGPATAPSASRRAVSRARAGAAGLALATARCGLVIAVAFRCRGRVRVRRGRRPTCDPSRWWDR